MINRVVEGLNQHDDAPSVIVLGKMQDLVQIPLLCNGGQFFSRLLRSSSQCVEACKRGEVLQSRDRRCASEIPHIAFLRSEQVHEGLSHTAKRSFCSRV